MEGQDGLRSATHTVQEKLQRAHEHAQAARNTLKLSRGYLAADTERDRQLALIEVGLAQYEMLQLIYANTRKPAL